MASIRHLMVQLMPARWLASVEETVVEPQLRCRTCGTGCPDPLAAAGGRPRGREASLRWCNRCRGMTWHERLTFDQGPSAVT